MATAVHGPVKLYDTQLAGSATIPVDDDDDDATRRSMDHERAIKTHSVAQVGGPYFLSTVLRSAEKIMVR